MGVDCINYTNTAGIPVCTIGLDVTKCNLCLSRRSASPGVRPEDIFIAVAKEKAAIAGGLAISPEAYTDRLARCISCPALNRTNSRGAGIGHCSESLAPVSQFTELTIMARSRQTSCPRGIWPEPT